MYVEAPDYPPALTADLPTVFLVGGIANCPHWQQEAAHALADFTVFNPRRRAFPIHDPAQTPSRSPGSTTTCTRPTSPCSGSRPATPG